jgi:hypothetical protein
MGDPPEVFELDGRRGGQYFAADLSDGRRMLVSRKPNDRRVWLGRPGDPQSYDQQRDGIGLIPKLLDEWFSQIAEDEQVAERYWALSALDARRKS